VSSSLPTPRDPLATASADPAALAPATAPGPEALGRAADRYVLEREIGRGGMGRVFLGRDLRLGRPVAMKVLLEPSAARAQRFEREVRLAARLQHPGIVAVYDSGFWPTGEPYLVMRLVLGRSLARALEESETLADRLALLPNLIAAADAVAYAHDQGVVHRDLKPSNIIVGAFGETVVVDWGLARDLGSGDSEGEGDAGTTEAGTVLGTPGYMAPEQAAGLPVDARADVYALGALLAHVLTGEPPRPEPARAARGPADLLAIAAKALAADPKARYPTAFELADDLKRFQTAELVAARPYSLATRSLRWSTRHPVATTLLLGALALLAALLSFS
jgi:eukaryotic-like serine/threonine-protein kinase